MVFLSVAMTTEAQQDETTTSSELQSVPEVQLTGAVADKAALLAFKSSEATNEQCADLRSWQAGTEPCMGESSSSYTKGWTGVMCTHEGDGRLSIIDLQFGGVGGDIKYLGQLTELRVINLSENPGVRGDIGRLMALSELVFLGLYGTSVHGAPESLRALHHLGTEWMAPAGTKTCMPSGAGFSQCEQDPIRGHLFLAKTHVAGPVEQLLDIDGLGDAWTRHSDSFTPCSAFSSACHASGLSLVANAADIAGRDECACCAGTRMVRNEESGMCDNVEEFEITFSSGPVGQRGKVRTYGADDYEREVAAANQRH